MTKVSNLTGKVFDRLTVVSRCQNTKSGRATWYCFCICGNNTTVIGHKLTSGHTKSCGCFRSELTSARMTTHGKTSGTRHDYKSCCREYKSWAAMKGRVARPMSACYRKISIHPEWRVFENFLRDMGSAPSDRHQIDRIDGTLGYYPGNCRWATSKENSRNKFNNLVIEWEGESKCMSKWVELVAPKLNVSIFTLYARIKNGWSVQEAFTTPNKRIKLE